MHIGWSRIWKVLLGCACAVGSIVLLACGLIGWGIAALEAAALLLALQYAPRAAQLWKTWWFVELVLVLAATVGYTGFVTVRTAQAPASAVVITTERDAPQATPVPETETPEPTAAPEPTSAPDTAEATCVASRKAKKYHRPSCQYAAKIKEEHGIEAMECTDDVIYSEHSRCFEEAENRMHTIKAIMAATLGNLYIPRV